jgi:oligopeptide transport system substrate-binding protein
MSPLPALRTIALAALATLAAACAEDRSEHFGTTTRTGKSTSTFYVNAGPEPELIDPGRAADAVGTLFVSHLYEGLSVYDARDVHPTQGVAHAWDRSNDNRLFRFHLRKEALWADGKRVTAGDFAYAWARVLRPSLASRAASNLYVLLNGELYQRGKLKVAKERLIVRDTPAESGAIFASVEAGTAVRILKVEKEYAQIAPHRRLPTFDPSRPPPEAEAEPKPLGFVPVSALVESPSVLGVRALDDDTLEVETERPAPYFLDLTCYSALSPMRRDVVEPLEQAGQVDKLNRPEHVLGNGAYSIADWKFRYELTTTRSPTYWRASEVKLERVVWMMLDDSRTAMNLYKAGDLDYLGDNSSIPSEVMPFIEKKKDFLRSYILSVYWYEINVRKPPLDDARVRRALNLAIDKEQLVRRVTKSGQIPATHYVPELTGSGYADAVAADKKAGTDPFSGPGRDFDPGRARALLTEAGFAVEPDGEGFRAKGFPPLEILYNTSEGNRNIAVAIQDFWRRHLGISAQLRNEEFKVMIKNVTEGNYQVARGGWGAEYNHPQAILDLFLSYSPSNRTGWVDPEYDRLVAEAAQIADPAQSIRKFREAEQRAVDAMPRIPFYFYTKSTLVKPWVKGFTPNVRNVHLTHWMWIDPTGTAENTPAAPAREYAPPGRFDRRAPAGDRP